MRTGSPDFERRRKLRDDLRGGWDSFLLLCDSGMGGMPFDFWDGKLATEPFVESMMLALLLIKVSWLTDDAWQVGTN